jgi:hypothetical protein
MKKIIIIFGMLLISLQLPFCPYRFLSSEWVNRLELGRKFLVPSVLQAYGVFTASQNKENRPAEPRGIVSIQVSYSLPHENCTAMRQIVAQ